jgi:hypothetical protein
LFYLLHQSFIDEFSFYKIDALMHRHGIAEDVRQRPASRFDRGKINDCLQSVLGIRRMGQLRLNMMDARNEKMHDLLFDFRFAKATDPKDKIYGAIGMASDVDLEAKGMEISYDPQESVQEVYERFGKSMMSQNAEYVFYLLYEAGMAFHTRLEGLPSWIPDWSQRRAGSPLGRLSMSAQYSASVALPLEYSLIPNPDFVPPSPEQKRSIVQAPKDLLVLKASYLDFIIARTASYDDVRPNDPSYLACLDSRVWLGGASNVIDQLFTDTTKPYAMRSPTGPQTIQEAFWRTLIGNKTRQEAPAPPSYGAAYQAFRKHYGGLYLEKKQIDEADEEEIKLANLYRGALQNRMFQNCFAVTNQGLMCMIPGESENMDMIVMVAGSTVPFVVRRVDLDDEPEDEAEGEVNEGESRDDSHDEQAASNETTTAEAKKHDKEIEDSKIQESNTSTKPEDLSEPQIPSYNLLQELKDRQLKSNEPIKSGRQGKAQYDPLPKKKLDNKTQDQKRYKLIGECYVHGGMSFNVDVLNKMDWVKIHLV